ncbi:MAG: Bax inhibitor-1/YccA family protein [Alphaproteobacteria bacterium]|nr:MAG: Bax inhibitor-1/YccA family protein [Alphaproteobacteria bacterium]
MADFERQYARVAAGARAGAHEIDEGLRAYMLRVYNYMAAGLAVTGITAYLGAATGIYQQIAATPFIYLVMFAPLIMVFVLSARIHKMSVTGAQLAFWVFAALMGLSLSYIFLVYAQASIVRVFFITAAAFGGLSLYGYTTKKDLSGWGSFLIMGLIGIIIAAIVNIFLVSSALHFAISVIGVLVFAGLTAYDTQRIKEMYYEGDGAAVMGRKAIMGALSLYLDFINLFLMLLSLFGSRE